LKSALTENSYFADKVQLRLDHLPKKDTIRILDCFSADGSLWKEIQKQTAAKLLVLRIEKEKGKKGTYLPGDNLKYLKSLDLSTFDVIDLDAFGVPHAQLKIIFERLYRGHVYVTFIPGIGGLFRLPDAMLEEIGYTRAMVKKVPSLFARHPRRAMLAYLARHGVQKTQIISIGRKHYFHFEIPAE
jgi:hypothetical protein